MPTMTITRFAFPTAIHFGAGARKLVAAHLLEQGCKRPLIVTDRALARCRCWPSSAATWAGWRWRVRRRVRQPHLRQVMAGAAAYKAHGADCVIGFGGGAALDVAKVVGVMAATHDGDILEYVWDHPQVRPIVTSCRISWPCPPPAAPAPRWAARRWSARTTRTSSAPCSAPRSWPRRCSPTPSSRWRCRAVTAATGMDALTHNIESYLSPAYHPLCDGIALEGLRIGARALVTAVKEPGNLQARADMMMSSMMGAIAFQKDLGSVHACAHALGAVADLHHGLANALMIDTVLAWNHEAVPKKFDELAHVAGVAGGGFAFVTWLKHLKQQVGITGGLAAHGVTEAMLPRWCRWPRPTSPAAPTRARPPRPTTSGCSARRCDHGRPFQPLLIGVSARIYYPGSQGALPGVFTKTLHYLEQSVAHWVLSGHAMAVMIPAVTATASCCAATWRCTTTRRRSTAWCCRAATTWRRRATARRR
jgi:alcohol dehydrogenase class IV